MMGLYERLHEIKKVTGWSQEKISTETGLNLSTISRIFRIPCYSVNETSVGLICQLHNRVVKSPFPEELEQLFKYYDDQKENLSQKEFSKHLWILESLLVNHKDINNISLISCRLAWLIGHIYFDRAFYLKNNPTITLASHAIDWYQKSLNVLKQVTVDNSLSIQEYKLQQCIISTKFNCCDSTQRSESAEIKNWLINMKYLELVQTIVKEDSWNWEAARNGLVAASILKSFDECLFFWKAMVQVNKSFADLDFKPSKDLSALNQNPDLKWFVAELQQRNF